MRNGFTQQNLVALCAAKLLSAFLAFFKLYTPVKWTPHYAYFLENRRIIL
jgi:hypothetical protein